MTRGHQRLWSCAVLLRSVVDYILSLVLQTYEDVEEARGIRCGAFVPRFAAWSSGVVSIVPFWIQQRQAAVQALTCRQTTEHCGTEAMSRARFRK